MERRGKGHLKRKKGEGLRAGEGRRGGGLLGERGKGGGASGDSGMSVSIMYPFSPQCVPPVLPSSFLTSFFLLDPLRPPACPLPAPQAAPRPRIPIFPQGAAWMAPALHPHSLLACFNLQPHGPALHVLGGDLAAVQCCDPMGLSGELTLGHWLLAHRGGWS